MMKPVTSRLLSATLALALFAAADAAHALRCGNKLVVDGMHEEQVKAICGEPVSTRTLGLVLRYYDPLDDDRGLRFYTRYYGYGARQELVVTEMLYNFGPHKLMRILRFEGGRLTDIETAGYGYRE